MQCSPPRQAPSDAPAPEKAEGPKAAPTPASAAALATRSVGATAVRVLRMCRASARRAPPCYTFPCATARTNRALELNSDSACCLQSTPPSASTESPTDAAAHSTIRYARCIMQTAKSRAIERNFYLLCIYTCCSRSANNSTRTRTQ